MKVLSVLLAALTVTSVAAHAHIDSTNEYSRALVPRVPGKSPSGTGTGGRPKGDGEGDDPAEGGHGGKGKNPEPVANQEDVIKGMKDHYRDPKQKPELSKPQKAGSIGKGGTGWEVDTSKGKGNHKIKIKYGKWMRFHASSVKYHHTSYPKSKGKQYELASEDVGDEGRKESFSMIGEDGAEGTARDEKSFNFLKSDYEGDLKTRKKYGNSYDVNHEASTVVRVPGVESTDEGTMAKEIKKYMQENPGTTVEFEDNRDPDDDTTAEEAPPLKGPLAPGFDAPHYQTGMVAGTRKSDRDHNTNSRRMRFLLPRDASDDISSGESNADDTSKKQAEYLTYFQIFDNIQANASRAIFPILDDMVRNTNDSMVWDAAWSIFGMISPDVSVIGPFYAGMNCFSAWEADMAADLANMTNRTLANHTMDVVKAYHYSLIDVYDKAYANATRTLNSTGLLDDLEAVEDAIASTNDTNVLPEERLKVDQTPVEESDDGFFVQPGKGNETLKRAKGRKTRRRSYEGKGKARPVKLY